MKKIATIAGGLALIVLVGAGLYLKSPTPAPFDRNAAIEAATAYDARIIRDAYGVPHIYGARDEDVAFGLAYAHAEDDWATIEEVIFFTRGTLAQRKGRDAAIPDFLIGALGIQKTVYERYETDLPIEARELAEAYAAGVNLYCAEEKKRCAPGAVPVSGEDIVAGFVSRTPFFYGLDAQLKKIFEGEVELAEAIEQSREAFLRAPQDFETGSNAMAVAPSRSTDGHTRLMVNSHQPYEGPVAWYEARVKSEEGWDLIGGLFPGAPLILHGAGPDLGWAFTVNKPDLVDVYALDVDNEKKPTQYRFDGEWRQFEETTVKFRVKLFGPFSLPINRRSLTSVHGPVFVTDNGVFAVSYGGANDIRGLEQWRQMNKATNFDEWRTAMSLQAIPSFNVVYGDGEGNIAYFYNMAIPVRAAGIDWTKAQAGDDPELLWQGVRPFGTAPHVVNPQSGYVVNANHTPFQSSAPEDNPVRADYPAHYGISDRTTNRGYRIQALYGGDPLISEEEFLAYKFDNTYAEDSRVMELVKGLVNSDAAKNDDDLSEALSLLDSWDGAVTPENRAAILAIATAQRARGVLLNDEDVETPDPIAALKETMADLQRGFGRIDPTWGEAVRLQRGDVDLAIYGGPDTLRAVYPWGELKDGALKAVAGDTHIVYADWSGPREVEIKTIHQFGAATLDETSPHYDDQAPIFVAEEWKSPPMTLDALLAEATSDKKVGASAEY